MVAGDRGRITPHDEWFSYEDYEDAPEDPDDWRSEADDPEAPC